MIQRIQTIYLLLAALVSGGTFLFPFATTANITPDGVFADGLLNLHDQVGLLLCVIGNVVLAVLAIFMFNNRKVQLLVSKLVMLLSLAVMGLVAYFFFSASVSLSIGIGLFLPILSLILTMLAHRGISQDEQLVRSMDRIR